MDQRIPVGLCQCGCGQHTEPAKCTRTAIGQVKGQPLRFRPRHRTRIDPSTRFWPKVEKTETCWLWTSVISPAGYGMFGGGPEVRAMVYAHRWAYVNAHGPIPEGLELDHLCRVKHCVNPAHLEAVTHRENMRRAYRGVVT